MLGESHSHGGKTTRTACRHCGSCAWSPSALMVPLDTATILLFSRSLPGYRLYCWVEDGAVKLSLLGSLSFHEGWCTSFFQILW